MRAKGKKEKVVRALVQSREPAVAGGRGRRKAEPPSGAVGSEARRDPTASEQGEGESLKCRDQYNTDYQLYFNLKMFFKCNIHPGQIVWAHIHMDLPF